jgi:hypothetical protein
MNTQGEYMNDNLILPTLTLSGWLKDKQLMMTKLFDYFLTSDYNQTTVYFGHISSLKYLIKVYGDDEITLKNRIDETLTVMYSRYYDHVDVDVDVSSKKTSPNLLDIKIDITATDSDGKKYTLGKSMTIDKNRVDQDEEIISLYYTE